MVPSIECLKSVVLYFHLMAILVIFLKLIPESALPLLSRYEIEKE